MENKTSITAKSQGFSNHDNKKKKNLPKYAESYQAKAEHKNKNVQKTADNIHLNLVQRQMYRRLMYGLKEYSPEQISAMSYRSITQVVNDYQKASKVLHIMKAKVFYKHETNLIRSIFPHHKIGDRDLDWLMELPRTATLKKLGISTKDVINEFIKRKLLPSDFFSITPENMQLK